MELKDKYILVTGASSGIGQAIAIEFAKAGAFVIAHYNSNIDGINTTMQSIKNLMQHDGYMIQADLTEPEAIDEMFLQINKKFGKLNVIVNNAGQNIRNKDQLDQELWEETLNINVLSIVRSIEISTQTFKKSLNKIINISSIYGVDRFGGPDSLAYSASKAALNSLTRNLAKTLAPKILVNSIAPGYVLTPLWGKISPREQRRYGKEQLIERFVQAEEIADATLFLAKNDGITGEVLVIDGGLSLKTIT